MSLAKVLRRPIVTEKSTIQSEQGRYVFEVDSDASKHDIAKAVEWAFDVKVVKRLSYFGYSWKNIKANKKQTQTSPDGSGKTGYPQVKF